MGKLGAGITDWLAEQKKREEINRLKRQIEEINSEIRNMLELKQSYYDCKNAINTSLDSWNQAYEAYKGIDLAPDIQVPESFEGVAAKQLALDVPTTVTEMADSAQKVGGLLSGIDDQITKLTAYIEKLNGQIRGLQAQIAAIS